MAWPLLGVSERQGSPDSRESSAPLGPVCCSMGSLERKCRRHLQCQIFCTGDQPMSGNDGITGAIVVYTPRGIRSMGCAVSAHHDPHIDTPLCARIPEFPLYLGGKSPCTENEY